jgi:hypothetical protein
VLGLLAVTVAVVELTRRPPPPPPLPPTPRPSFSPAAPPIPTATPELEEHSSDWLVARAPSPTPVWWPTSPPTRPRTMPDAAAAPSCVTFQWDARQTIAAWGYVLVEIEAHNRCSRALHPDEAWFQVTGLRDGAPVHTARGHPFNTIFPGRSERFGVGLPGSLDWYDLITVQVVE